MIIGNDTDGPWSCAFKKEEVRSIKSSLGFGMTIRALRWSIIRWKCLQLNCLKRIQIAILILAAIVTTYALGAHLIQTLAEGMLGNTLIWKIRKKLIYLETRDFWLWEL